MFQMIFVFCLGAIFGFYYPELVEQGLFIVKEFINNLNGV